MKKRIVILGGGTGGTMLANRLARAKRTDLHITVVEQETKHLYQPGLLFLPFGLVRESSLIKPVAHTLPTSVRHIESAISRVACDSHAVILKDGTALSYDALVIATGVHPAPEEVPGMHDSLWYTDIFDFYTLDGARALAHRLATWKGGAIVVHITEVPIKCPVAPLEFVCLLHDFLTKKHLRERTKITYVIPLSEVFTKHTAGKVFQHFLTERNIQVVTDFATERIAVEKKTLVSYDGRDVPFDLLVTVPPNMGSAYIRESGLGDELNLVPTNPATLQSKADPSIFVLGDAGDIPASKAGSATHFQTEILTENLLSFLDAQPLTHSYDGHANCFLELGGGKAAMIDFNYSTEPLPGTFPLPIIGPFHLLKESRINHWGKRIFSFIYWHFLLKDRPLPFLAGPMRMWGKVRGNEV